MASDPAPRIFVFGLGYSARVFARRLSARGWRVAGTTRNPDAAAALRAEGFEVLPFDRDRPLSEPAAALAGTTHLLASIPPDAAGDPVLDRHGREIAACAGLAWAGYLSTTGVYGDRAGGWVDEDSALEPTNPRATHRVSRTVCGPKSSWPCEPVGKRWRGILMPDAVCARTSICRVSPSCG